MLVKDNQMRTANVKEKTKMMSRDHYRMLENFELLELVNDHSSNPELAVVLAERLEDLLSHWDYNPNEED